jgi:hypothetical protein
MKRGPANRRAPLSPASRTIFPAVLSQKQHRSDNLKCLSLKKIIVSYCRSVCMIPCSLVGGHRRFEFGVFCAHSQFRRFQKFLKKKGLLTSSCISVRLFAWSNSVPTGQIFMKFRICKYFFFSKSCLQNFKFH